MVKIPADKIGELIGPGGRVIRKLMADTGTQIDVVDDDGSISVSGVEKERIENAVSYIEGLGKEVAVGEVYQGVVVRVTNFGAFVNILPGKDGMVHVSDMTEGYVADANDIVKVGDKVQVRIKEVDATGRISLSMRMDPSMDRHKESYSNNKGFRNRFNRGRGNTDKFKSERRSSGPHFPTSRYFQSGTNIDR